MANINKYLDEKTHSVKWLGIRRAAIIEALIILVVITLISIFTGNQHRYLNVHPHPFWIAILIITVQYGTNEGVFTSILSVIFLYAFNVPQQHFNQDIYSYTFMLISRPLLWLITAVILGMIRDRLMKGRDELKSEFIKLEEMYVNVDKKLQNTKQIKETLEKKFTAQLRGTADVYNTIKSVETLNKSKILLALEQLVTTIMSPDKFSIFAAGENGLESVTSTGWSDDEPYARRFNNDSKLYQAIVKEKRSLVIVNTENAKILGNEGMMASPIVNTNTNTVIAMVKIEKLNFNELNTSNIQSFTALCHWISMAYSKAETHTAMEHNLIRHNPDSLPSYFAYLVVNDSLKRIEANHNLELTRIRLLISLPTNSSLNRMEIKLTLTNIIIDNVDHVVGFFEGKDYKREVITIVADHKEKSAIDDTIKCIQQLPEKYKQAEIKINKLDY